jgi:hypothetical protein
MFVGVIKAMATMGLVIRLIHLQRFFNVDADSGYQQRKSKSSNKNERENNLQRMNLSGIFAFSKQIPPNWHHIVFFPLNVLIAYKESPFLSKEKTKA